MAPESVYWTFGAAAQALAALVGFLLAGYALVHSKLESSRAADDSMVEILDKAKQTFHRMMSSMIILTVAAITADLGVVYVNSDRGAPVHLQVIAGALSLMSLGSSAASVVFFTNPLLHRRIARRLARAGRGEAGGETLPAAVFFDEFVKIERYLHELFKLSGVADRREAGGERNPSLRTIVGMLGEAGVLPIPLASMVQDLIALRNVVFHGEVEEVTAEQMAAARKAKQSLQRLASRMRRRRETE